MMTAATMPGFAPRQDSDRNFFLLVLAAIWAGIFAGFVPDSLEHLAGKHVAFAPIVHVHALTFVGWLVLLSTQIAFIRSGRVDLHRRLGILGAVLIPVMLVLGPYTSLVMGARAFGTPDSDPAFLILPMLSAVSFAVVSATGLLFRGEAAAHKRLMLLGTVVLSDAGFARWIAPQLGPLLGHLLGHRFGAGFIAFHAPSFIGSNLIIAAMVGYDLATRGRPHPVVASAMVFVVAMQVLISTIYLTPAWTPIATHILGH